MTLTLFAPLAGGILIGLAASVLALAGGRVAGISSILGEGLRLDPAVAGWRWTFLAGLLAGGVVLRLAHPAAFPAAMEGPLLLFGAAGLLVGVGTRLGSGCTSGHGVCGLARLSPRSLVATLTFIAVGALTVFVTRHVLGGLPG
jgi:uncharacterized membrane protein YedE/YeeE